MKFSTVKHPFAPFKLVIDVETKAELDALMELCMLDTSVPNIVQENSRNDGPQNFLILKDMLLNVKKLLIKEKHHD